MATPALVKASPDAPPKERLQSILESLIFVADAPITERQLAKAARCTPNDIRPLLATMTKEYQGRGIELHAVAGGYQFRSSQDNAIFVRDFIAPKPVRMTRVQLETLSIVAYRQPVTRPEVDDIRGVDSGAALKLLSERGFLKVLGRKDEPGRPLLYGTSPFFLEFFGLASLQSLPTLQEFSDLSEDSRALFERKIGEPLDLKRVEAAAQAAEASAQAALLDAEEDADSDADNIDDLDDDDLDDDDNGLVEENT